MRPALRTLAFLLPVALAAAAGATSCGQKAAYQWDLPQGFPAPALPMGKTMSDEKVALGRYLFYDKKLSDNQTYSCATCHDQAKAFTDGRAQALGSTGMMTRHSALGLTNVAYLAAYTWQNPGITTLEDQARLPMFGEHPPELALAGKEAELLQRLRDDARYPPMFAAAFPDDPDPLSDHSGIQNVLDGIGAFERTLISGHSAYDRFTYGHDASAMSDSAQRGLALFNTNRLECYHCHGGFNFSGAITDAGQMLPNVAYHNTGLYDVDGRGADPVGDQGLIEITEDPIDMGKFRPPTLRNIALTAPYMHDGSIATLGDVLDFYGAAGRNVTSGPNFGDGRMNPFKDIFLHGFTLSPGERDDMLAFLNALTDDDFVHDPRFSDPFAPGAAP